MTVSLAGSAPARSSADRVPASCTVTLPDIWPEPPVIGSRITGALSTLPSSTMANGRPTLASVMAANSRAPVRSKRKLTTGSRVCGSNPALASDKRSPLKATLLRTG